MDSSKRAINIELQASNLDELKLEMQHHLQMMSRKQIPTPVFNSNKVPMGIAGDINPGEALEFAVVLPLAGHLQDFMSFVTVGNSLVFVEVTVFCTASSQRVSTRLMDDFRNYDLSVDIPANSFAKIKLVNRAQDAVYTVLGFTFKEDIPNAINKIGLVGSLEGRTI